MKKVSCKMFFTVLWRGICQVLGWFFGLFGYKRDGKFAKCVWGLFAVSATLIVTIFAGVLIFCLGEKVCREFRLSNTHDEYCYSDTYISRNIKMHDEGDGNAWVFNTRTGKKTLSGIAWISKPLGDKDSLVVYSDGMKRGYFNKYTGEVVIPAKYAHAWVFSDGIASVEEDGIIKFIDTKGKQVFDRTFDYDPNYDGHVFHGGYCIIDSDSNKKYGLMNTKGETVIPEEYDDIQVNFQLDYWTLNKGDEYGVYDSNMNVVLAMMPCKYMWVFDDCIDVTMPDNTMRKYDYQGNLIDDFYISLLTPLEYETEEVYQTKGTYYDDEGEEHEYLSEPQHKTSRARLWRYIAGDSKEGLMTSDGRAVTMPKYEAIEAIGPDTYLCTVSHGDKVVVNGKGEQINCQAVK